MRIKQHSILLRGYESRKRFRGKAIKLCERLQSWCILDTSLIRDPNGGKFCSFTEAVMRTPLELTTEEQVLFDRLKPLYEEEALRMAKAMATKPDAELLGRNEFEIRDRMHELGAKSLEVAINERQKKGRIRRS